MDRERLKDVLRELIEDDGTECLLINGSLTVDNTSSGSIFNSSYNVTPTTFKVEKILVTFLALVGITANVSSLAAMCHIPGRFSANQRLIVNLVITDLFVSLVLLVNVHYNTAPDGFSSDGKYGQQLCIYMTLDALVMTCHAVSLLNLVVLAVDHYLAINKPLKYLNAFTSKRVLLILVGIWVVGLLCGFSDFLLPAEEYSYCAGKEYVNFCEVGYCSKYETKYLLFPLAHVCFIAMVIFYSRVFVTIYRYQRMQGRHQRHVKRNIKGLITTLIILATFFVCWLPHCVFQAFFLLKITFDHVWTMRHYKTLLRVDYYLYGLWLVNNIFDPIIYAVRMREVKQGYFRMAHCDFLSKKESPRTKYSSSKSTYRRSVTTSITCEQVDNATVKSMM